MVNKSFFIAAVLAGSLIPDIAYAVGSGNDFVSQEAVPINSFMMIIATLLGLVTFGSGIYGASKSSTMPQQYPVRASVTKIIAGVLLLSAGGFYEIIMNSINMANASGASLNVQDSALITDGADDLQNSILGEYLPKETIKILLSFIYLVGLFSFLKGVYMLKDLGGTPAQQQGSSVGTASLVHIVGGIISMNITTFSCIVGATIGLPQLC